MDEQNSVSEDPGNHHNIGKLETYTSTVNKTSDAIVMKSHQNSFSGFSKDNPEPKTHLISIADKEMDSEIIEVNKKTFCLELENCTTKNVESSVKFQTGYCIETFRREIDNHEISNNSIIIDLVNNNEGNRSFPQATNCAEKSENWTCLTSESATNEQVTQNKNRVDKSDDKLNEELNDLCRSEQLEPIVTDIITFDGPNGNSCKNVVDNIVSNLPNNMNAKDTCVPNVLDKFASSNTFSVKMSLEEPSDEAADRNIALSHLCLQQKTVEDQSVSNCQTDFQPIILDVRGAYHEMEAEDESQTSESLETSLEKPASESVINKCVEINENIESVPKSAFELLKGMAQHFVSAGKDDQQASHKVMKESDICSSEDNVMMLSHTETTNKIYKSSNSRTTCDSAPEIFISGTDSEFSTQTTVSSNITTKSIAENSHFSISRTPVTASFKASCSGNTQLQADEPSPPFSKSNSLDSTSLQTTFSCVFVKDGTITNQNKMALLIPQSSLSGIGYVTSIPSSVLTKGTAPNSSQFPRDNNAPVPESISKLVTDTVNSFCLHGKDVKNSSLLKVEFSKKNEHSKSKFKCSVCGEWFYYEDGLNFHLKRTVFHLLFNCTHCKQTIVFYNKCSFWMHIKQDTGKFTLNYSQIVSLKPYEFDFDADESDMLESVSSDVTRTSVDVVSQYPDIPRASVEDIIRTSMEVVAKHPNIPRASVEIVSKHPDIPRAPVEVVSKHPNIPRASVENVSKHPDIPKTSVEVVSKHANMPRASVEVVSKHPDIPRSSVEVVSKHPDIPKASVEVVSKCSDTTRLSMEVVSKHPDIPKASVEVISKCSDTPRPSMEVVSKHPDIPRPSVEVVSKHLNSPSASVQIVSKHPDIPKASVEVVSKCSYTSRPSVEVVFKHPEFTTIKKPDVTSSSSSNQLHGFPKCPICLKQFPNLAVHLSFPKSEKYVCPSCEMVLPSVCALEAHIRIHRGAVKKISCPECGENNFITTSDSDNLRAVFDHLDSCKHFNRTLGVKCFCNEEMSSINQLTCHFAEKHLRTLFKCPSCILAFTQHSHFVGHMDKIHNARDKDIGASVLCLFCQHIIKSPMDLMQHVHQHIGNLTKNFTFKWKCFICVKLFVDIAELNKHMEQDHPHRYKRCTICYGLFWSRKNLVEHIVQKNCSRSLALKLNTCVDLEPEAQQQPVNFHNYFEIKRAIASHGGESLHFGIMSLVNKDQRFIRIAPKPASGEPDKQSGQPKQKPVILEKIRVAQPARQQQVPPVQGTTNVQNKVSPQSCKIIISGRHCSTLPAEKVNGSVIVVPCVVCKRLIESTKLTEHLKFHQSDGVIVCPHCQQRDFSTMEEALQHSRACGCRVPEVAGNQKESTLESAEVEQVAANISITEQVNDQPAEQQQMEASEKNVNSQTQHSVFPCLLCGLAFQNLVAREEHVSRSHDGTRMVYYCGLCRKKGVTVFFSKRELVSRHITKKHRIVNMDAVNKLIRAEEQNISSGQKIPVNQTAQSEDEGVSAPKRLRVAGVGDYMCGKCGFSCSESQDFSQHIASHNSAQEPQCPECGLCFTVFPALKKHLLAVHKIRGIDEYLNMKNITEPVLEDEEDFDFQPEVRPFNKSLLRSLESSSDKLNSLTKLSPPNPLECRVCYKVFDVEANLKTHMRNHGMAFIRSKRRKI